MRRITEAQRARLGQSGQRFETGVGDLGVVELLVADLAALAETM